jgi:hypothetical protein
MPVPGYDPDDVDTLVEDRLDEAEIEAALTDDQLAAYRAGDADITALLSDDEIRRLLDA